MSRACRSHDNRSMGSPHYIPANTRHSPNAGLMLAQRLRRWSNINPALGDRLVIAGLLGCHLVSKPSCHTTYTMDCCHKCNGESVSRRVFSKHVSPTALQSQKEVNAYL